MSFNGRLDCKVMDIPWHTLTLESSCAIAVSMCATPISTITPHCPYSICFHIYLLTLNNSEIPYSEVDFIHCLCWTNRLLTVASACWESTTLWSGTYPILWHSIWTARFLDYYFTLICRVAVILTDYWLTQIYSWLLVVFIPFYHIALHIRS